jgi:hypothetical protein
MRPSALSALSGQTAQEVSYLDEIDDDKVLNALRSLRERTAGVPVPVPVAASPADTGSASTDKETDPVPHNEEKKDAEEADQDEDEGFFAGLTVPLENLHIKEEDEPQKTSALEMIMGMFTCTSVSACDSMLFNPIDIEARVMESRKLRSEKPPTPVVNKRMQKLSFKNRKLAKGPIEDDETVAPPEQWVTKEQQQRLETFHLQELAPMLVLIQKVNAFLFLGRNDVLELHSISQMLNRMEERLENKLETMRGYNSGNSYMPRAKRNAADVPSLATKTKRVYDLILEVSEELVLQEFVGRGDGHYSVAESTWGEEEEEEATLADTLTLNRTVTIPANKRGDVTVLPAISSFLDLHLHNSMPCGGNSDQIVEIITENRMQCGDVMANTIEIMSEKEDGSAVTYDFSAMDKKIAEHVQEMRTRSHKPLPGTIQVIDETVTQAPARRRIQPVNEVENRAIEVIVNNISSVGKPPLPNAPKEKGKRNLLKNLSIRFGLGGGSQSGSKSSLRSLKSRSKNGSTSSAASQKSASQNSVSRKSVASPHHSTVTAPVNNLADRRKDVFETDRQTEVQLKDAQQIEEGGIKWTSGEEEAASGRISNKSSPSGQASNKSSSSAQQVSIRSPAGQASQTPSVQLSNKSPAGQGSNKSPSVQLSKSPSVQQSKSPSKSPSVQQSKSPSKSISVQQSKSPSNSPSVQLSKSPSVQQSKSPSKSPSGQISNKSPAASMSKNPPSIQLGRSPSGQIIISNKSPAASMSKNPPSIQLGRSPSGQIIISSKLPAEPMSKKSRSAQLSNKSLVPEDAKLPQDFPSSLVVNHNTDDACSLLSVGS